MAAPLADPWHQLLQKNYYDSQHFAHVRVFGFLKTHNGTVVTLPWIRHTSVSGGRQC